MDVAEARGHSELHLRPYLNTLTKKNFLKMEQDSKCQGALVISLTQMVVVSVLV